MSGRMITVRATVNGVPMQADVEARMSLADLLRTEWGLTGTHIGCEHGVCGVCTVQVDGVAVRSCLILAPQVDGSEITTVEGLAGPEGRLHPIQQAFTDEHALQCGFCTPGMLMAVDEMLEEDPSPDEATIHDVLGGQLCRCTGYQGILRAVHVAAVEIRSARSADAHA